MILAIFALILLVVGMLMIMLGRDQRDLFVMLSGATLFVVAGIVLAIH